MTKLFYILSLLIIKVASNYISTHLWSGEKKLKKRVLLQTLILTACFLPTHGQDSFLCFQTNVQKSNISIHEQRMKHPGHSQTACVHSKHIGIGNEDTGNDHGAGKTKYNKSVPFLALKTNMLFDIALIPNIEVEVPVGKCWSLNGELMFPWWLFDNDKYCMQILSGGLETRYWLDNKKKRNILTGHFAGLYAGGDSPSKTRIWAAQKRNAPFAVIKSTPGTKTWTFTLIELSAENMIQVMGGTTEDTGIYVPPTEDKDVQGVFDIETVTGHTIRIYNGVLTCNFANGINFSNVLGIECELEIQEAGEKPPYKVFPPGQVPPASEITSQS